MSVLERRTLDLEEARLELDRFSRLLDGKGRGDLGEASDILPFFAANPQLCILIGLYNSRMSLREVAVAREFSIFGDYRADQVVGDLATHQYCFCEFEDAKATSLFKSSTRQTPGWSSRYERGYSQLIDWILWIENNKGNTAYKTRFGADQIYFTMLLVIGRDRHLARPDLRERFHWRSESVVVASKKVQCITYDHLYADLKNWVDILSGG